MREEIRRALVWRSFSEVITYSFISREMAQSFSDSGMVQLTNPISQEMAFMRPSIISSLMNPLRYNINRQKDQIKFFEIGKVFKKEGEKITEGLHLAAVSFGNVLGKQWDLDPKKVDFFDMKADMISVLGTICNLKLDFIKEETLGLHPGQSAVIYSGDTEIGIIGAIHPELLNRMAISGKVLFLRLISIFLVQTGQRSTVLSLDFQQSQETYQLWLINQFQPNSACQRWKNLIFQI